MFQIESLHRGRSQDGRKSGLRVWQVVPEGMEEMFKEPTSPAAERATTAVPGMKKLDIAALREAYDGVEVGR